MPNALSPAVSLNRRLVRATFALILVFTTLLGISLAAQMSRLASRHLDAVGEALAAHLADTVRQPLADRDPISLQVALDNLFSQHPRIERVSIYDASGQLHAQKKREGSGAGDPITFSRPVTLGESDVGSARIELANTLPDGYFKPLWYALAIWLLVSGGFLLWIAGFGGSLSARLHHLCRGLPGIEDETGDDELTVLEKRIAPLLINAAPETAAPAERDDSTAEEACTLAIHCRNLPRLKAQLNKDSFERQLAGLEDAIARTLELYDGRRLPGSGLCVFLRFSASGDRGDHALRALSCAHALFALSREKAAAEGVKWELAAVLDAFSPPRHSPQILIDLAESDHQSQLHQASTAAESWQILLRTPVLQLLADSQLVVAEILPDNGEFARFSAFADTQQVVANQQIAYLRARRL